MRCDCDLLEIHWLVGRIHYFGVGDYITDGKSCSVQATDQKLKCNLV